MDVQLKTSG